MLLRHKMVWTGYAAVLGGHLVYSLYQFFNPSSQIYLYFAIMQAFDPIFVFPYWATFCQLALNIACFAALVFYIYRIRFLSPSTWQQLLILRFIFDVIGHPFDLNHLVALWHASPKICLLVAVQTVTVNIPSYFACYQYAFRQDKLFPGN